MQAAPEPEAEAGAAPEQAAAPSADRKRKESELKRKHAQISAEVEALTAEVRSLLALNPAAVPDIASKGLSSPPGAHDTGETEAMYAACPTQQQAGATRPPCVPQVVKRRHLCSIPPAATTRPFTPEELERLDKAHKDRLWELVGKQAPAILKAVRAHKVPPGACRMPASYRTHSCILASALCLDEDRLWEWWVSRTPPSSRLCAPTRCRLALTHLPTDAWSASGKRCSYTGKCLRCLLASGMALWLHKADVWASLTMARCCSGPGRLTSQWTRSASRTTPRRCLGPWTSAPSRPGWTGVTHSL